MIVTRSFVTLIPAIHILGTLASNQQQIKQTTKENSPLESAPVPPDEIADETIKLINRGKELITFNPAYKNVVLVIGNTGAGKTTITKFVTGQPLESYKKTGKFLIRDTEGKISTGSTLVSKTIYPEMFVHKESNTAYYDLPGFSDTRNSSIELANAFFMKLVADQVEKVKILVVVTHSALIPGENRRDFKALLENAVSFILHPAKFQASIALVATKVNSNIPDEEVVPNISEFLGEEKEILPSLFGEGTDKLRQVLSLVDAFLTQSPNGNYERIGFFKDPKTAGPLESMPEVQQRRQALKNLIENQTTFVQKQDSDFGISVSQSAKYYIGAILDNINSNFMNSISKVASQILQHFHHAPSKPQVIPTFIGKFVQEVAQLRAMTTKLQQSKSRLSFIQVLDQHLPPLMIFNAPLKELRSQNEILEFYEMIDIISMAPKTLKWTQPFRVAVNQLQEESTKFLQTLNSQVESWVRETTSSYQMTFDSMVQNGLTNTNYEAVKEYLGKDVKLIEQMKDSLLMKVTLNSFVNGIITFMRPPLNNSRASSPPNLTTDLNLQNHPELKKGSWLRPISELLLRISTKYSEVLTVLRQRIHEERLTYLRSTIVQLQAQNAQLSRTTQARIAGLWSTLIQQNQVINEREGEIQILSKDIALLRIRINEFNGRSRQGQMRSISLGSQLQPTGKGCVSIGFIAFGCG